MWKMVSRKLRPKVCTKRILNNFDEAVLRRKVHNFYLTEKHRPTLKAIHSKTWNPLVTENGTEKNGI